MSVITWDKYGFWKRNFFSSKILFFRTLFRGEASLVPTMSSNQSKTNQTYSNLSKPIQTYLNLSKPIQTYPNLSKPIQTYPNISKHIHTLTKIIQPIKDIQTYSNQSKPNQTFQTNQSQKIHANLS
jgi:hypothetical protein